MHITFLQLHTNNLPALQAFYSSLGFHVTLHDEYIDIPIGTTLLRFQVDDTPLRGGYHFAINVAVPDIAIVRDWLRAHTPIIQSTQGTTIFQFDEWHAQAIYCYDPDNNIVEFIVRSDIVTHPHTSFRVADSLCVSEIGLACTDVPATIAQFRNSVTIPDFFHITPIFGRLAIITVCSSWCNRRACGTPIPPSLPHSCPSPLNSTPPPINTGNSTATLTGLPRLLIKTLTQ